ncbi:mechanosensitive ion channel family protein [Campylobacter hyointestinalis]|uniref:Mechanosensitive ion channel protein n=1 Tax=Campylobacter hyointestinalis subsp. hyointestinalis TaxID=91352 RepID=A0A855N9S5_CAMHY|nr:mechanosensitive ion channel domain-containing protein [Campylobacter hyointestinalis]ANE33030.1 small conductance mechanosensitive channel protein [Campylobacter hyointestinalis subsp. hyointestinalis LMG 9260]KEA43806.1 mechanosensitive ion channel protein [Campylobacter hyointestinalis subsp. hyointestinalis]MBT0612062.1 mechanosensitive ion channel [Campylobacter hyointestinalis subsp. hyointestinalis]MDY2998457.1 mechanosensitive ion channel [Campylobacter hyointestinalis]PPB57371.1 me
MNLEIIQNLDYMAILALVGKYSLNFIVSILIFFIGKWIISKLTFVLGKILCKTKIDPMLSNFVLNSSRTLLFIFVILAALSNLGIETTSFVAVLGAVGLAIGMAFKDTFGNIGAGVLIIFFKPFKLGDSIDISGSIGTATELDLFSTYLTTGDNKTIIIPNSQVISSKIINYSLKPNRRVDLTFSIDYKDDLKLARDVILDIAARKNIILNDPAPFVGVLSLGDNSVNLAARFWAKNENYWAVYHQMLEEVKIAFDENGISIPFPQVVTHHIYENDKK